MCHAHANMYIHGSQPLLNRTKHLQSNSTPRIAAIQLISWAQSQQQQALHEATSNTVQLRRWCYCWISINNHPK
jgi:hypothetical protein